MRNSRVAIVSVCAAAALVPVGLAGAASARTAAARVKPPHEIKSAGKLVYCSDITYPPEEFYGKGTTHPEGSDIDIGTGVARLMGVKAQFDNTGFDGIIPALLSKSATRSSAG
jgi:polar amino acid transport system substrate-binding protein